MQPDPTPTVEDDAPIATVSSPFANARKDAREYSSDERLAAASTTQRASTASIGTINVGADGIDNGELSSVGGRTTPAAPASRAQTRDGLDELGAANPMPEDAMSVSTDSASSDEDPRHHTQTLDSHWIRVAEILFTVLLVVVIVIVLTR